MPDEQGTAQVPASGPAPTASAEGQQAQPATPAVESTPPTEAPPAQPTQTPAQPPNYEEELRRAKAQYEGLQGNFRQTKAERDRLAAERAQWERERATMQASQDRQAEEAERARLKALANGDAEDLKAEVQRRLAADEARRAWEAEHLPRIQREAYQAIHGQYEAGIRALAEQHGLTPEDVAAVAQGNRTFDSFINGVLARAVEKKLGNLDQIVQQRVSEALRAAETRQNAQARATERPPDTTQAGPPNRDDDATFMVAYADGEVDDHKRARAYLARLTG